MRIEIEDYSDVVASIAALRKYALALLPVHLDDTPASKRDRVFKDLAEIQNLLFSVHWDLSRLDIGDSADATARGAAAAA